MSEELQPLPPTNPLILLQTALDKGMDPEKLGRLIDLSERWEANQAAKKFGDTIQEFQRRMPAVVKENPVKNKVGDVMYSFANYEDILAIAQPILTELGIVPTFTTSMDGNLMRTTCRIRVGTHFEETSVTLALPAIPNANDAQRAGGAVSYGQRYSLKMALNIIVKGEDNDALSQIKGITPDQAKVLNDLLGILRGHYSPVKYDEFSVRFWKFMGCEDMSSMPAADFEKCRSELERTVKKIPKGQPA